MAKKQKKLPVKAKSTISKKYVLFFCILIAVLFFTLFQVQNRQTYQQHAQTATCGAPGDQGNELGVGKFCTQGGGQCLGTNAPICSADVDPSVPGICSKACNADADCGTGAVCFQDTLGKGCEPVACETSPTPGATSPSPVTTSPIPSVSPTISPIPTVCLGAGCPQPSVSQAPSTQPSGQPQTTTTPTPTNNGGGSNLLQLFLQLIIQFLQLITNLFKGI